jgi:hypothetical protein
MTVTPLESTGNSAKFNVVTKRGAFIVSISSTMRNLIWQLPDAKATRVLATELAEAIVSRHDPQTPFKKIYVFAEHNSDPSAEKEVQRIRKYGIER